jgi:ketosteroid isomerase-like protein
MHALVLFLLLAPSPQAAPAGDEAPTPVAIVASFHEALSAGDRETALALLDPETIIFEQGGAEMSRDEYASRHLTDDLEFSRATRSKTTEQRSDIDGDTAWVLTRSETSGTFRGKKVALRNAETIVLKSTQEGWKIVHIHWSSYKKD